MTDTLESIPARMREAWNRGDAAAFFADFADDAELVEFDGTVTRGRTAMIEAQRPMFATVLQGSRMVGGEVPFARVVAPGFGVVHHRVGILLAGQTEPADAMQLFAVVRRGDRWEVAAVQTARLVPMG